MRYKCERIKGEKLCDFEVTKNAPDAIVEVCIHCGRKEVYWKDKQGRIDNKKYVKDHKRDLLQRGKGRTGKLFEQVYGKTT